MFILSGLIIGIPLILIWFFLRRKAQASMSWPKVPGRIIASQVRQTRDADGQESPEVFLTYSYSVGVTPMQGTRVSIGTRNPNAVVKKYPAGTDVQVYYDPQKPSSAVLEPGGSGITILLIVGVLVIIVGVAIGLVQAVSDGGKTDTQGYSAAMELYKQGKFGDARAAFEVLAKDGSTESMVYLGVIYTKGQGVPQDFIEGEKWFILSGELGKKNREVLEKGLTPAQQQQAESMAKAWKSK